MRRRWAAAWLTAGVAAVGALAFVPAQRRMMLHSHGELHPWIHLVIFGGLAWLATGMTRNGQLQMQAVLGVALFGSLTEYVEAYFYGGPLETNDILLDVAGAFLGLAIAVLVQRRADGMVTGDYRLE